MINRLKKTITTFLVLLGLMAPFAAPAAVYADIQGSLCGGATQLSVDASPDTDCQAATGGSENRFQQILADIINIFSLIVGIIAVIMIIFAGFKYITSGGNQENVKTAKQAIIYAIIGLIIVALAQIIVKFVLNQATNPPDQGKCTQTPYGYYWVGGPNNGTICSP